MPDVVLVEADGNEFRIEVASGTTARDAAVNSSVPGIDGDCGGVCACATCHVHVDPKWIDIVGTAAPGSVEAGLIQFAEGSTDASRLACQVTITPELNGLVLHIPKGQH